MSYRLKFHRKAHKEWTKLDAALRAQFSKVLLRRLEEPHVPSARLHGLKNMYKIKARGAGYRLVYRVFDNDVVVMVIAVGPRDDDEVYETAKQRVD